jgi:WD40 repeat protein/tRNA A-37 threonylcarbamoyl transferase component Bud32
MQVRCPHCHQPVELIENAPPELIDCPSCGSAFRVSKDAAAVSVQEWVNQALANPAEAETVGRTSDAAVAANAVEGRAFGEYELQAEIARGGMGVVYKARQRRLNRTVAVKMILAGELADKEDVKRFLSEAEAAAGLDHPGIVPVYESGEIDGQHFFSMGFVEGQSLAALMAAGPLSPQRAAELVAQVASAVEYAHERGVIHRDLKPGNILLDKDGNPRVTDFGLAKRVAGDSGLTRTGQALGTPSYMPPEQASGRLDAIGRPADVYALGAVLYAALTGRPPFQAATPLDTILQVLEQQPVAPRQLNADIPRDLETIALKCLEKEPHKRYATASELADELHRFLAGEPIHARPASRPERVWRWCRRNPMATAAVVSLLCGAAVSSYFAQHAWRKADEADVNAAAASRNASQVAKLAIQFQTASQKVEREELSGHEDRARAALDRLAALRSAEAPGRQKHALAEISAVLTVRSRMRELAVRLDSQAREESDGKGGRPAAQEMESANASALNEKRWRELLPRLCDEAVFWLCDASSRRFAAADSPAPPRPDGLIMSGTTQFGPGYPFGPAIFTRDGQRLARLSRPEGTKPAEVQFSNAETGAALWTATLTPHPPQDVDSWTLAFSADGEQLFVVCQLRIHDPSQGISQSFSLFVDILDTKSGNRLRSSSVLLPIDARLYSSQYERTIVVSPDCEKIIVSPQESTYPWQPTRVSFVVDIKTEKQLWSEMEAGIRLCHFTPDSRQVIGFRVDPPQGPGSYLPNPVATAVELRDALTGTKMGQFDLSPPWTTMPSAPSYPWISPDGKWLAGLINRSDYPVALIEAATGRLEKIVPVQPQARIGMLPLQSAPGLGAFTNDGRFLTVAMQDSFVAISIPQGAVVHRQAIRLRDDAPFGLPRQVPLPRDRPELTRLDLLDDGTRLIVGVAASPGKHQGHPLPQQELVDMWDLALPQITLETRFTHSGLLNSACLDERQPRLYFGGDASCGLGAMELERQMPAALLLGSPDNVWLAGLAWSTRGMPGRSSDNWRVRLDRGAASGFDATGHGYLEVDDWRSSIDWFDAVTGGLLNQGQFGRLSADRRRAVFCNQKAAHVFELADNHQLARFEGEYWCSRGIQISPRGNYLLSQDGTTLHIARIVDGTTATVPLPFPNLSSNTEQPVVFSNDESLAMLIGYEKTTLVDLVKASQVVTLEIPYRSDVGNPAANGDLNRIAFFRPASPDEVGRAPLRLHLWSSANEAPLPLGGPRQSPILGRGEPLTFTPDGSRLIVHSLKTDNRRHALEIWDTENRRQLASTHDQPGNAEYFVVYDKVARMVVFNNDPAGVPSTELWDLQTGKRIAEYAQARVLWPAGTSLVPHTRASGATALLVKAEPPCYCMIDVLTGQDVAEVAQLANIPTEFIKQAVLRHDMHADYLSGDYRSALGGDLMITRVFARLVVWRMKDRRHVALPPEANVFLGFSPDGRQVATFFLGADDSVRLWDTSTGQSLGAIAPFAGSHLAGRGKDHVDFAHFSPDGKRLAVDVAGQTRFVNVETRKTYASLPRLAPLGVISSLALSGDGQLLAAGDEGTVELRDSATGEFRGMLDGFGSPVTGVAFLDGDRRLATLDGVGTLVMWRLESLQRGGRPVVDGSVLWQAAVASHSPLAVSGDQRSICAISEDGQLALFASSDGRLIGRLTAPSTSAIACTRDGNRLVAGSTDGKLRTFQADDEDRHSEWSGDQGGITALALDPTGRLLATAGRDLRIWRIVDQQRLLTLSVNEAQVHELRFSEDGQRLLCTQTTTTGTESEIRIIDLGQLTNALVELGFERRDF